MTSDHSVYVVTVISTVLVSRRACLCSSDGKNTPLPINARNSRRDVGALFVFKEIKGQDKIGNKKEER